MYGVTILQRLVARPLYEWSYTGQGEDVYHMGPMVQDFYTAFWLGEEKRHINTVDADGVVFAAIQGLNELVVEQTETLAAEDLTVQKQNERIEQMEDRFEPLEEMLALLMEQWSIF